MWKVVVAMVVFGLGGACGKSEPESSGGGKPGSGTKTVTLENVGLKADVPPGARVTSTDLGTGNMVSISTYGVSVKPEGTLPRTLAAAIESFKTLPSENVTGVELADGWLVTFELTGTDPKATKFYYLKGRRHLDTEYSCDGMAFSEADRKVAAEICKSLRK